MIPFAYLCHRLLSSAFVRFWLLASPRLLISRFSFVRTPSVEKREGFFFAPKHSHEKFFRNFFQIYPRRLFADFLARICDEGNGCPPFAIGGGTLFLWACGLPFPSFFLCSGFRCVPDCWGFHPCWCRPSGSFFRCVPCWWSGVGRLPSFPFPRSSLAPALIAFPLSLWASVPDWLTASGWLWTRGAPQTGQKGTK